MTVAGAPDAEGNEDVVGPAHEVAAGAEPAVAPLEEEPAARAGPDEPGEHDGETAQVVGEGPGLRPVEADMWRLVVVAGVRLELPSQFPEILLHEQAAPWRELKIPVGLAEGTAIAHAWRGEPSPRPLTHELVTEILDRHNVKIECVRITTRQGGVFFAELDTRGAKGRAVVPARPSDAIALVLRATLATPILVADWVFAEPTDS
jgi:hypothetical protein